MKFKKEKARVQEGKIAHVVDTHCGIGDDGLSYILEPGMSGLVVSITPEITTLLIHDKLVEVRGYSLEVLS